MEDALPLCNFATVNFETRKENRKIEMDGLTQAHAILRGAEQAQVHGLLPSVRVLSYGRTASAV